MSQLAGHAHVSLHPLASRHGTNSSTLVSVNVPSDVQGQSRSHGPACDEQSDREEGQGTPRLHQSYPEQRWSGHSDVRSPSPKPLPQAVRSSQQESPSYGIQHEDLDEYPVIYEEPLPSDSTSDEDDEDGDDPFDSLLGQGCHADSVYGPRRRRFSKRSLAAPIRAMSAAQLAELHDQYVAQDVPHNVVFPFLHGVDGSIPAQNVFFGAPRTGQPTPLYRGLTILRADMPNPQEVQRMQGSTTAYTSSRARARTFSSVTTQSSGSSPDTDDESSHFDATWNAPKSHLGCIFSSNVEANPSFSAESAASVSPSNASTVSSQPSRPSLFSVSSESYSTGSRTSVSTVSDIADVGDDAARTSTKIFRSGSPAAYEAQPRHSVLNSTVFPSEVIRAPVLCRTLYGRNVYGDNSQPGSFSDEGENTGVRRIGPSFINPPQASGVSLRNFKIQCAKYATISDIVIYCPSGYHPGVLTLAKWVREAQASLRRERLLRGWGGLQYNVFVVTDSFDTFEQRFPSLVSVDSNGFDRNRVDFVEREREEMERMTRASEIHDNVWLGCTADVPGHAEKTEWGDDSEPLTPDEQANPHCFSVCINCEEDRSLTSGAYTTEMLRNAAQYLDSIDASTRVDIETDKLLGCLHRDELLRDSGSSLCESAYDGFRHPDSRDGSIVLGPNGWTPKPRSVPVRTDASASHFVHTKSNNARLGTSDNHSDLTGRGLLRLDTGSVVHLDYQTGSGGAPRSHGWQDKMARKLIDICVWIKEQASPVERDAPAFNTLSSTLRTFRDGTRSPTRSFSPSQMRERRSHARVESHHPISRRPRRVLLHCPDGYTETSVLALSYLMYVRDLSLAEAYLDLQLRADRSFFVYPADVAVLEAVDRLLQQTRAARCRAIQEHTEAANDSRRSRHAVSKSFSGSLSGHGHHTESRRMSLSSNGSQSTTSPSGSSLAYGADGVRRSGLGAPSPGELAGGICRTSTPTPTKCRADLVTAEEKHTWFDNSRFDGSFPSRILPFLYLGNLDHASNVDMLRVLGITHLVSVGETALPPPDHISAKVNGPRTDQSRSRYQRASAKAALAEDPSTVPSCTYQAQGIAVLNVRNVSDDGIDSLRGTMREAVQFIEAARLSGGKVLVHCRVGVSRSTTIVLAYVMAHLDLGLVESYLLVRSRRLNIVIQPHLLFLWELRGWETFLFKAKQAQVNLLRARLGSPDLVRSELPREASHALSTLSIRTSSARSEEGSGSYKSAWSSPTGSPLTTSNVETHKEEAAPRSPRWDEDHLTGVEIGAGAGSIHGFDLAHSATLPFGSGSPTGLPYSASRLTWGHLAREIADLNSRYFV